jgi:tetratricopeptide (TPR) repeat protein
MNHPPKIFIIYSADSDHHADRVLAFSDQLRKEGIDCNIDQYESSPSQGWARWRREQLEQADYILVVCTAAYNRRVTGEEQKAVAWEKQLLEDAIYQTVAHNSKAIPVLFSPEDKPHIPTFLGTVSAYVLYTEYEELYRHLTNQPKILKPELGILKSLPPKSKVSLPPNPYRGLEVFRKEHQENFFGRTKEIAELKQLVEQHRLVAVIGASGSGKSSLVLAGLVPALEATQTWVISEGRPNTQPFDGLAAALVSWLYPDRLERLEKTKEFAQKLNSGKIDLPYLVRDLQQQFPEKRFLLIIDQFEEVFTLTTDIPLQQRFLDRLLDGVQAELPLTLLFTLRADFMGQVLAYGPLATALDRHAKKLLSAMETDGLREAIEAPAKRLDVSLETGLTQRILDDVGKEPGNLPLLEFALTELWAKQQYGDLTHAAYEEIGGVQKALARYADKVYQGFDATTQAQVRQVFMRLVHPGEGTGDTRQMATRDEVRDWVLVRKLADARLVVTGQDENTHQDTVEVVHEALIRHWQPLQQWVKEDRKFLVWLHDLRHKEQEWRGKPDEALLLRGFKLEEAQEKLKKYGESISDGEKAFIEASVELQQREREAKRREREARQRLRQRLTMTLMIALVVVLGVAIVATRQWWKAKQVQDAFDHATKEIADTIYYKRDESKEDFLKDITKALMPALKRQLQMDSQHPTAWLNKGRLLLQKARQSEGKKQKENLLTNAKEAFEKQLNINPKHKNAQNALGLALLEQAQTSLQENQRPNQQLLKEARRAFQEQLNSHPDHEWAWFNLGISFSKDYNQEDNLDEMIRCYRKQLEVKPDHRRAWLFLGLALMEQGQLDEAIKAFRKQPDQFQFERKRALGNLGVAFYKLKKYNEAAAIFADELEKGFKFEPFDFDLEMLATDMELALVQGDVQRFQKRQTVLSQLVKKDQELFVVLPFLTWLSQSTQSWKEVWKAIEELKPGLKFSWKFSEIQPVIDKQSAVRQKVAKAFLEFFERQVGKKELQATLEVIAGEELATQGEIDQALANYTQAQQLDPEVEIAAESWETLCYFGSFYQQAEKVLGACERAEVLKEMPVEQWVEGWLMGEE